MLVFSATGGHIRSGPDVVKLLGPFLIGVLGKNGEVVAPMGTPNTVVFLTRGPGRATIDVVTGDPWRNFDTTTVELLIKS